MTGSLNMNSNAITKVSYVTGDTGKGLFFDDNSLDFWDSSAIFNDGGTNVWLGRVNDTEASRIAALGTPGSGWTNLASSGTGNAVTNLTASGDTLTFELGTIEGGGNLIATNTPTAGQMLYASDATKTNLYFADAPSGTGTPLSSTLVSADWTWTNTIYAVGADTSSTNIAITLPDAGTNFASVVIRKFSNLNNLTIMRGTNVVYTLSEDGSTRSYDWWPQRTNWYWRN